MSEDEPMAKMIDTSTARLIDSRNPGHLASREPGWPCTAGDGPWPCETAQRQLRDEFKGERVALSVYLGGMFGEALQAGEPPGPMYERMFSWLRSSERER